MEKITVLVEVHGINSSSIDFDIPFPKGEDANIINLTKKLSRKNTTVKQCIDSGNYMYKVESSIIKGRWILIGEDSPLKHGTTVRCEINNNNNSTSAYHNETLEDSGMFSYILKLELSKFIVFIQMQVTCLCQLLLK